MTILHVRITHPCILVAKVGEPLENIEEVVIKLSIPWILDAEYEARGVIALSWSKELEQNIETFFTYVKNNNRRFWWTEENHLTREQLNERAPLVPALGTVWKEWREVSWQK